MQTDQPTEPLTGPTRSTVAGAQLADDELARIDA